MFKQQLSYYWRPEEINLSKDKGDFNSLSDHEKFMFKANLGYQILLDTVQSRGISHLLEDCTNPEIEAFAKTWEFFETLHSYSYTYIIKNVYSNPSEVFDEILNDPEIIKRTSSVTKYYDALIEKLPNETEYDRKKKLYLTLISINILEGVRFYVSFACTYCFAQNKKMEGNAKIISLINRDENIHMGFTSLILKYMAEDASEGFTEIVKDCKDIVIQMYKDAAVEEMAWAEYLFKDGSMIGLNAEILIQYMKWLTNNRMKMIKLEPIFDKATNPISWITNWTDSKGVQEAPQETEIIAYTIGSFKQDVDDMNLDDFQF
jgi:ribonucleoside-diphosphate reductase beta chain